MPTSPALPPRPLVLLRHGESTANAQGLFTGSWDVALSQRGRHQARRAARLLRSADLAPDLVFTSPLLRAGQTVEIVLRELGRPDLDQLVSPALTERAYGALTGLPKTRVGEIFGAAQTQHWRRSMTGRPPRLEDLLRDAAGDALELLPNPRRLYADVPAAALAAAATSESLADVVTRVRSWTEEVLSPRLHEGRAALVVAHGNSLRALVSILDGLDTSQIQRLNIPTGEPLCYTTNPHGHVAPRSGRYLDPVSAAAAAQAVAEEGGT